MLTVRGARDALSWLVAGATAADAGGWAVRSQWLLELSGREWLLLDDLARTWRYGQAPVSGTRGWLGEQLTEQSGAVAAVSSLHADGRIRQRATRVLAATPSALRPAALAVRTLDHVEQVRADAVDGLRRLPAEDAPAVLGVLLAGRRRQHGAVALQAYVEALWSKAEPAEVLAPLRGSEQREVLRWAYDESHRQGLLGVEDLTEVVASVADQRVRAACAQWLRGRASADDLGRMLGGRYVDGRLLALQELPDAALPDAVLLPLLADPSGRVRELAQWRARRRGADLAAWYRDALAGADLGPSRTSACLAGLAGCGTADDLPLVLSRLAHPSPTVRAEAVRALVVLGDATSARTALLPLLEDPAPKVSAGAARALARAGAGTAEAAPAWRSARPATRRAAWLLSRTSGTWERVDADTRAAADPDPQLAALGRAGLRNWLHAGAATTWGRPAQEVGAGLLTRLAATGLSADEQRQVAFHAGLALPTAQAPAESGKRRLRLLPRR